MDTSKYTILLVDDDPALLRLLSIRLTATGYDVMTADNGAQALTQLAVHYPNLVITDLQMDGMDGMALFDTIHRSHPTIPVIILTAHGTIPEAVAATQRGVFGFLTKPFDGKDLLVQVEKALRKRSDPDGGSGARDDDWRKAILTRSPLMEDVLRQVRLVAESDARVLIYGGRGTGTELIAPAIHQASRRRARAFVPVNCGAIPETLLESELFGYAKGAFTGATQDHAGLFQAAHQGTLFLDEIGDMPLSLQVKLLRVLQEKQVRPVGTTKSVSIDVRIISATHRSLEAEMPKGNFREDLYYRLKVVALQLPNLAAHREDIPLLATHFLERCAANSRKHVTGFAPEALEELIQAPWPGNVRHLLNVVEQAVILSTTPIIPASLVQQALSNTPGTLPPLDDAKHHFEQEYLVRLLKITHGNVSQAARLAGRNRTEFYRLLERHHLDPVQFRAAEI
jgi:two-component system response regulator GlrR